jgi:hypothetical protein
MPPMSGVLPTAPVISPEFTIQGEILRANSGGRVGLLEARILTFPSTLISISSRGAGPPLGLITILPAFIRGGANVGQRPAIQVNGPTLHKARQTEDTYSQS